jgi:hypothetical protein
MIHLIQFKIIIKIQIIEYIIILIIMLLSKKIIYKEIHLGIIIKEQVYYQEIEHQKQIKDIKTKH